MLSPKQFVEIPVGAANNFGLTFIADEPVYATLIDEKGSVVGENLAKTPDAATWFRSIYFDKPTTAGKWKLKWKTLTTVNWKRLWRHGKMREVRRQKRSPPKLELFRRASFC